MSRLLADFEAKVRFALFERRQGCLLPTVDAHTLQDEVEHAFFGFERVAQAAAQIRAQRRGVVRVLRRIFAPTSCRAWPRRLRASTKASISNC
ncbi:hypothetical protein M3I53_22525 [Paraburkholderia sp. CNPSo 3272]|uniref:hypothetical protein n=1 Tax=Paraburkholderia sp. CNPSo 3272 TaxID=2940931 RepID=UPI0020B83D16|nr:hypothetical protein [Paraburkholderia sp. CNPSo 3272]MCP3725873.1 hypothetical protein [Paraburkholderia sp. CNPSo 3272]